MQCLYCGKGIGPIRQIRDVEFCSEAHRTQFRERYRQQVYAALAPEPAPSRLADFTERMPAAAGPAPYMVLRLLPKYMPGDCQPAMRVEAAGVEVERPGWIFGQALGAMPRRLAWQDCIASYPSPVRNAPWSIGVQALDWYPAGAAPTLLAAGDYAARPLEVAPRVAARSRTPRNPLWMPEAARAVAPVKAGPAASQFRAAVPVSGDLAAIGPVPPAIRADVTVPCRAAIAAPIAPQPLESARQAELAPAAMASQPRPALAPVDHGSPVAFDPPGTRNIGIAQPQAPAAATAFSTWIAAMQRARLAQPIQPELRLMWDKPAAGRDLEQTLSLPETSSPANLAPIAPMADLQPAVQPVASTWNAALAEAAAQAQGSLSSRVSPAITGCAAPIGALAESVQPECPAARDAGNRTPRFAEALAPALAETPAARLELPALAASSGAPDLCQAQAPTPAAPPAAVPSWDATRVAAPGRALVPLAGMTLPRIDCLPAPAGALARLALPLRPEVGRAVRSCAVLWTLRVVHMFSPPFRMDPVRARFNDLVRSDKGQFFSQDREDAAKTNLRVLRPEDATRSHKLKWQLAGSIAAALLLAGGLRLAVAAKGFEGSLPWRGMSVRQWMSQRATRNFEDDFRAGLNQWKGVQAKWPKSWSYNTDGFMHPGQLALYRPSVPLADYKFEFMAQIENKSVDWVVRAHDADNYYALKFTVLQPGPRPIVAMVRYPVIEGSKGARVQTPLRMMIHANTPYRVTVDVKGNRYRAYIEGQEADFWTEDRLKTGGVGFFSEAGERARVYWVKLESHGDILGRICGLLSGGGSRGSNEAQAMDYRYAGTPVMNTAYGPGEAEEAANTAAMAIDWVGFAVCCPERAATAQLTRRNKLWITGMREPRI